MANRVFYLGRKNERIETGEVEVIRHLGLDKYGLEIILVTGEDPESLPKPGM